MPSCKEIQKSSAPGTMGHFLPLPMVKIRYGGSSSALQVFWRLLQPLAPYMGGGGVPGTFRLVSGLLPVSRSPENCELALCPVHYTQVWLLVTTYLTLTAPFVGIPSAAWGTFTFPGTCKNGNLHFAPSVDAHWVSAWQSRLICMDRAALSSSFGQPSSTCTINTALINYGGKKSTVGKGMKAFSF